MLESPILDRLRTLMPGVEKQVRHDRRAARLGGGLDAALPWDGLPYRVLHEVSGLAATGFAAALARRFLARGGVLVWCRQAGLAAELGALDGDGLARFGLGPERVILVRCRDEHEVEEAFAAALRCHGTACAVAEIGRLDLPVSRRLQQAAEAGGGAGLLLRPEFDPSPSAALTRWRAEPLPAADGICWRLLLWHVRDGLPGIWPVRWDERTLTFTASARRAAGTSALQRPFVPVP